MTFQTHKVLAELTRSASAFGAAEQRQKATPEDASAELKELNKLKCDVAREAFNKQFGFTEKVIQEALYAAYNEGRQNGLSETRGDGDIIDITPS